jgi:signal transduction histidine kinase
MEQKVEVDSNPVLAGLLINNLLSNAINHNLRGGIIRISLNNEKLEISNTGRAEIAHPDRLFARFYKESTSGNSVGLGLAIVSKIGEMQHWKVSYSYHKPMHSFQVIFEI